MEASPRNRRRAAKWFPLMPVSMEGSATSMILYLLLLIGYDKTSKITTDLDHTTLQR